MTRMLFEAFVLLTFAFAAYSDLKTRTIPAIIWPFLLVAGILFAHYTPFTVVVAVLMAVALYVLKYGIGDVKAVLVLGICIPNLFPCMIVGTLFAYAGGMLIPSWKHGKSVPFVTCMFVGLLLVMAAGVFI